MTNSEKNSQTTPETTYSSPLLALPGAAECQDYGFPTLRSVAWHYGNPLVEQRNFEKRGLVDRSNRPVFMVSGADSATFLNSLLSQKLINQPDGFFTQAINLDGQGRIEQLIDVSIQGDNFYLDLAPEHADSLIEYLNLRIFLSEVEITPTDLRILSLISPSEDAVTLPDVVAFSRVLDWGTSKRRDCFVPQSHLFTVSSQLIDAGWAPTGLMAYTAERVKNTIPEPSIDFDDKTIPHEVPHLINRGDTMGAVALQKGCYRGQETIARVENLGRSPRLLVMVHLDGSAPLLPEPGAVIEAGDKTVGRLGTIVHDHDFGPIGLALIKRNVVHADTPVVLHSGDTAISIDRDSIPVDESSQAGRAALNRLKGLM
ncbi:folate-binding protein [Corynebacterium mustelae]|uniref:Folate-binding protein n=1 Tax=Corynebacterium mustelae TaxID=571915 RepID=A0A0G3H6X0_9CORY|nr:folate-binding protein YgfZ [Corynebacterium mustelae]AKK06882.1 folate-binding protein [Corynebacterium mustelae]